VFPSDTVKPVDVYLKKDKPCSHPPHYLFTLLCQVRGRGEHGLADFLASVDDSKHNPYFNLARNLVRLSYSRSMYVEGVTNSPELYKEVLPKFARKFSEIHEQEAMSKGSMIFRCTAEGPSYSYDACRFKLAFSEKTTCNDAVPFYVTLLSRETDQMTYDGEGTQIMLKTGRLPVLCITKDDSPDSTYIDFSGSTRSSLQTCQLHLVLAEFLTRGSNLFTYSLSAALFSKYIDPEGQGTDLAWPEEIPREIRYVLLLTGSADHPCIMPIRLCDMTGSNYTVMKAGLNEALKFALPRVYEKDKKKEADEEALKALTAKKEAIEAKCKSFVLSMVTNAVAESEMTKIFQAERKFNEVTKTGLKHKGPVRPPSLSPRFDLLKQLYKIPVPIITTSVSTSTETTLETKSRVRLITEDVTTKTVRKQVNLTTMVQVGTVSTQSTSSSTSVSSKSNVSLREHSSQPVKLTTKRKTSEQKDKKTKKKPEKSRLRKSMSMQSPVRFDIPKTPPSNASSRATTPDPKSRKLTSTKSKTPTPPRSTDSSDVDIDLSDLVVLNCDSD